MGKNKDFKFDKMAASYDDKFEGKLSKRFYNLLLNRIEIHQGAAVLDVGCGTGTVLKKLEERAGISGYGIDIEENMIAVAKSKCPDMSISVSSCTQMPFESCTFDIVTTCMAYHHFDDKKGFAKEASRILKLNGYLYITDPRFPLVIRKLLNFALSVHRITGYFGTPKEIESVFSKYGFELVDVGFDIYAQCIKFKKVS